MSVFHIKAVSRDVWEAIEIIAFKYGWNWNGEEVGETYWPLSTN